MSNRLPLTPGVSASFVIDLVDPATGEALPASRLIDAGAKMFLRTDPAAGSNVLFFSTPDPVHLVIDPNASSITLSFTVSDTNMLTLDAPYFYQVELDLANGEIKLPVQWTPVDVTLGGSGTTPPPPFASTTKITADYPLVDSMTLVTASGSPVVNAQIRVYRKSDYDAGNLSAPVGITTTNAFGKWTNPILVPPGYTYVARFEKPNEFGPDTKEFFA